ncbi:MAG: hypothetical protein GW778_01220 [Alphaproteobacteria bacterium]|nr:hypothetical protein [Alphaproteobacteria bacterium]
MPAFVSHAQNIRLSCLEAVNSSQTINAEYLFNSSLTCLKEGKTFEGTYLLNLGQMRSMTDLSFLKPLKEVDQQAAADLYALLYYRFGGPGDYEVYRDEDLYNSLVEKLEAWNPAFDAKYNPGWEYEADVNDYEGNLKKFKTIRFKQMREYHLLYSNEEYYKLTQKLNEISRKNNNKFQVGTKAYEAYSDLKTRKSELRKKILSGL